MRIMHVCPFIGEQLGGSERYVYNLSKVQNSNNEVDIVTTTKYEDARGTVVKNGVRIHRAYAPVTIWNIDPLCYALSTLTKFEYDILHIHSFLYTLSAQAIAAKKLLNRKAILQIHGGLGPVPYETSLLRRTVKNVYDRSVGRFVIENSDVIASVSPHDSEFLLKHYSVTEERLRYIPNAVDVDRFSPSHRTPNHDKTTYVYIGDFEPWKGLDILIRWALKVENRESYRLRFVGQGSMYSNLVKLKQKIDRKNNGIEIDLLGIQPHDRIPEILRNSDALILPSYWEGMPTVILEAMACGVPPIATPVGAVRSLVRDGKNGILIDHSLSSLDDALTRISENPNLANRMGKQARVDVEEKFSIETVARELEKLYEQITDGKL